MAEEFNPVVEIKLNGQKKQLRMTLDAMRVFKEKTGIDIFRDGIVLKDLDVDQFQMLVWCALRDPSIEYESLGTLIDINNWPGILVAVARALSMSMPKGGEKDDSPLARMIPRKEKRRTGWLSGLSGGLRSVFQRRSSGD